MHKAIIDFDETPWLWESAGLIIVQERVDLVYIDWVDQTADT
jgi:hypothetical protein